MSILSLFIENDLDSFVKNLGIFVVLTIILGGGAAFLAGRSLAKGWHSVGLLLIYMVPFTAGLRFLHFALFEGHLTSPLYFITHGLVVTGFALLGYRVTRANQMSTQYPWLYERSGLLTWRSKA
jgi:hypothetical protein